MTEDEIAAMADEECAKLGIDPDKMQFYPVYPLPPVDVKQIRTALGLSQMEFGVRFGLRPRTIQQWEQKRTVPDLAARILLLTIEHAPDVVAAAVQSAINKRKRASA
jgi:putative transcriptional regulator